MMDNHMLAETREMPRAGEKWRHKDGRHYLIQGLSQHAGTGETLVICRSLAVPFTSLAYPIVSFMGHLTQERPQPRFELVEED
jgi:hypothetical protein